MADEPSKRRPVIVGIGEVLWDMLPGGKQLGGAPANFAYHAAALGAEGIVVSRVGDDPLGHEILERLDALGLSREFVSVDPDHPTGQVDVLVDAEGVPTYVIREDVAWDHIPLSPELLALATRADAVCFGTLARRAERTTYITIQRFLEATRYPQCLRVLDVNLRNHDPAYHLIRNGMQHSEVMKLNDEEIRAVGAGLLTETPETTLNALTTVMPVVALTRGPRGSVLYARGRVSEHPGYPPAKIADTIGAGDAFTAAVVTGLLRGDDLDAINDFANRLASYVCTQPGATPPIPAHLIRQRDDARSNLSRRR